MPSTPTSTQSDDLPRHIPVDMGMAPRAHPYERHSVSPLPKQPQPQQRHQHSLSPEQLGVVGYVKDVAGFVKDTVQDIRENRQRRRSSTEQVEGGEPESPPKQPSPPPPAQQQLATSPLATIATGMFPGISGSNHPSPPTASPPCAHADALRQDLREQLQHATASDKEHRLL